MSTPVLTRRPVAEPATEADEFALDLSIVVTGNYTYRGDCPTSDGCGNTCSGNDSSCTSFTDDPA